MIKNKKNKKIKKITKKIQPSMIVIDNSSSKTYMKLLIV